MNELPDLDHVTPVDRAIALAEAALRECDEHGYVYAAIDLSSALDKLVAIKANASPL